jgi:hypothetical protein
MGSSPPCYDVQYSYTERESPVSNIYDTGSCPGNGIAGVRTHLGFVDTGF